MSQLPPSAWLSKPSLDKLKAMASGKRSTPPIEPCIRVKRFRPMSKAFAKTLEALFSEEQAERAVAPEALKVEGKKVEGKKIRSIFSAETLY